VELHANALLSLPLERTVRHLPPLAVVSTTSTALTAPQRPAVAVPESASRPWTSLRAVMVASGAPAQADPLAPPSCQITSGSAGEAGARGEASISAAPSAALDGASVGGSSGLAAGVTAGGAGAPVAAAVSA